MTYDDGYRDGYDDEYADEYDDGQYERGRQERPVAADSESLLRRAIDIIATAPTFPLSSTPRIDRDEIVQLLEDALERLPEDLRTARWMLRERQEFIAKTRREAEEILESGRQQAERMVQRTEVARSAEARARQIVEAAESDARRLRNETEDFIDQSLARFEILLNRLNRAVATGRNNLNLGARDEVETPDAEDHSKGFFDQEQL
jgi:cell division septum initiation protein DivIVA